MEEDIGEMIKKMILKRKAQDDPFPCYTNGDRKRDKEQDERQAEIFRKVFKDEE